MGLFECFSESMYIFFFFGKCIFCVYVYTLEGGMDEKRGIDSVFGIEGCLSVLGTAHCRPRD